jgi:D-threo-aldose 1-dehydrogenase
MYGLGVAELELGHFARGRREQITIATKFGIEPGMSLRLARLQNPARAALARLPALRNALKGRDAGGREPRRYDAAIARKSLEVSLRELGTDYVDLFFVHDPGPGDHVDLDELGALCEELKSKGQVRAWGVSGDPDPSAELVWRAPGQAVLQVRDDIFDPVTSTLHSDSPRFTFGVLSQALGRIHGHLSLDETSRSNWSTAIERDCSRPVVLASLLLEDALDRNRSGCVLFSTTRPERIAGAVAATRAVTRDPESPSLRAFRELVLREFPGTVGERG